MELPPHIALFGSEDATDLPHLVCHIQNAYGVDGTPLWTVNGRRLYSHDEAGIHVYESEGMQQFLFDYGEQNYVRSAYYSHAEKEAVMYIVPESYSKREKYLHPMETTAFQMIFLRYLKETDGLLLHANVTLYGNGTYIFTGPSGSGKTTLSGLLHKNGRCHVLTDETVLVWQNAGSFLAYGTPWKGSGADYFGNDGARLENVFFLRHGDKNTVSRVAHSKAIVNLSNQAFPYFWDRGCMASLIGKIVRLSLSIPCYEYAFLPDDTAAEDIICWIDGMDDPLEDMEAI